MKVIFQKSESRKAELNAAAIELRRANKRLVHDIQREELLDAEILKTFDIR